MSNQFLFKLMGVSVALSTGSLGFGQSVSVILNQPSQRDSLIASGEAFLAEREQPIVSDAGAADPFVGKVEEVIVQTPTVSAPVVKAVINEAELLQNLANHMSARGTVKLGDDWSLLLSQKRLKVGESITINFDGRNYEVLLVDVTSTTFTIRRNELSYTRAVLISR